MTMIATTMTLDQKRAIALEAATKLHRIYNSAIIGGGYPRDILLGAKPKDIDIFIDSSYFPSQQRRDEAADRVFAAFGQTWTRDPEEAGLEPNPYGPAPEGAVQAGEFQVYYSVSNDGSWENLNLIFSRHNERVIHFDWSICRAFVYRDGIEMNRQDMDLSNIHLMNTENMGLVVKHAKRIKEKYPTAVFKIPTRFLNDPNVYLQLLQGGIIDGPREILQAQGQIGGGDQVRLDLGAGDRHQAEPIDPAAGWIQDARVGATPDQVQAWAQAAIADRGRVIAARNAIQDAATRNAIFARELAAQAARARTVRITANPRPTLFNWNTAEPYAEQVIVDDTGYF